MTSKQRRSKGPTNFSAAGIGPKRHLSRRLWQFYTQLVPVRDEKRDELCRMLGATLNIAQRRDDKRVLPANPFAPTSATPAGTNAAVGRSEAAGRQIEMQVLKACVVREGYLRRLREMATRLQRGDKTALTEKVEGYGLVDLLVLTRAASLDVVETICCWRDAAGGGGGGGRRRGHAGSDKKGSSAYPRRARPPFLWNGRNYLIKMCHDLDFLSEVGPLVKALGLQPGTLRCNPFMMPDNLEHRSSANAAKMQMAGGTADGSGSVGVRDRVEDEAEMLRVHEAESVILLEVQSSSTGRGPRNPGRNPAAPTGTGDASALAWHLPGGMACTKLQPLYRHAQALLSWHSEAKSQIRALSGDRKRNGRLGGDVWRVERNAKRIRKRAGRRNVLAPLASSAGRGRVRPPMALRRNPYLLSSAAGRRDTKRVPPKNGLGPLRRVEGARDVAHSERKNAKRKRREKINLAITRRGLLKLAKLTHPPAPVVLVSAAALILLSPGDTVPADLSWSAVRCRMADVGRFLRSLRNFDGRQLIPQFKVRALQPFLVNPRFQPEAMDALSPTASALCAWVLRVVCSRREYLEWMGEKGAEMLTLHRQQAESPVRDQRNAHQRGAANLGGNDSGYDHMEDKYDDGESFEEDDDDQSEQYGDADDFESEGDRRPRNHNESYEGAFDGDSMGDYEGDAFEDDFGNAEDPGNLLEQAFTGSGVVERGRSVSSQGQRPATWGSDARPSSRRVGGGGNAKLAPGSQRKRKSLAQKFVHDIFAAVVASKYKVNGDELP